MDAKPEGGKDGWIRIPKPMPTPIFAIAPYDEKELQSLIGLKCWAPVKVEHGTDNSPKTKRVQISKVFIEITAVVFVDAETAYIDFKEVSPFFTASNEFTLLLHTIRVDELTWGGPEEDPLSMALRKAQDLKMSHS